MNLQESIWSRRAVRDYTDEPVDETTIRTLLCAAVQAPSANNGQPWSFVIVQDREMLRRLSDRVKGWVAAHESSPDLLQHLADPHFNCFYNASTLILICARAVGRHPDWDCCLAGQNLMLEARSIGLGTCVIGLSWDVFGMPEVKEEFGITQDNRVVLPIIVGHPKEFPPSHGREAPHIVSWIKPAVQVGV